MLISKELVYNFHRMEKMKLIEKKIVNGAQFETPWLRVWTCELYLPFKKMKRKLK